MAVFTLSDLWRQRSLVTLGPAKPTRRAKFSISPETATVIVQRVRLRAAGMLLAGLALFFAFAFAVPAAGDDPFGMFLLIVSASLSLVLAPAGAVGLVRWSRRVRSVRQHGWLRAHAGITAAGWNRFEITLPDRTLITTRLVAVPIPMSVYRTPVLIGGAGKHLTVLLIVAPILVPAKPAQM